jgi:hypothetical protein
MGAENGEVLRAAAARLEALAGRATAGSWETTGLLASRPEVVARRADGSTEHVAEARAASAAWITTVSPAVAAPLVAWLRATADAPGPAPAEALALAAVLLR